MKRLFLRLMGNAYEHNNGFCPLRFCYFFHVIMRMGGNDFFFSRFYLL
jgi:hypothetical protein